VSRVDSGINPPTFIEFPKHNYAKILCFIRGQCIICSNSHYLHQGENYAITPVCLSVILSVCRITMTTISGFHWNLVLWIRGSDKSEELLNFFGGAPPDTDSGSLLNFPHHCGMGDFRRFTSVSHTVTRRSTQNLAKWLTPTR